MERKLYDSRWLSVKRHCWSRAIVIRMYAERMESEAREAYLAAESEFNRRHKEDSKTLVG